MPRFRSGWLDQALIARKLSVSAAARKARVSRKTFRRAMAGETVQHASVGAILEALEATPPLVAGDLGDPLAEDA